MTRNVVLGDIVDVVKGISYRSEDYTDKGHGLTFVNLKNVERGGGFRKDGVKYYKGNYKQNQLVVEGDILIANTDLTQDRLVIGSPILIPALDGEACFSLDLSKLVIKDESRLDKNYLFYYLKSPVARDYMISRSNGSTVMHLSVKSVPAMPIDLPRIEDQRRIGRILKVIDAKIELNRTMNETLEQMGQALFRHYFIDNPESEKWHDGILADLGEVITGKTPSKANAEYYGRDVMFLKVPDMHGKSVIIKTEDGLSMAGADSQSKKYIPKWSTCVSCIATVGVVSLAGEQLQTNQQINSIIPKSQEHIFFNYLLLTTKSGQLKDMASGGSATPNLNKGQFEKIRVKLPPNKLLDEFHIKVRSLFERIDVNTREIKTLTNLRDNLLPRLINGKVMVD